MQYTNFYDNNEISSDNYGTVYTAKYKITQQALSRIFDKTPELFISEVSHIWCYN